MTTPSTIISVSDGPATTVRALVGAPMAIPARIINSLANTDIIQVLLRNAGRNANGLVSFGESTPIYLKTDEGFPDVEQVAEFGEIPVGAGQIGLPRIAYATKRGLGVRVSREMRDENNMDAVNLQITQLVNTMQRARVRALRAVLANPAIPTIAAAAPWDTASGRPRHDFAQAQERIAAAKPTSTGAVDDDVFEFSADTTVVPASIVPVLLDNENFLKVYGNAVTQESFAYTGRLDGEILGMTALTTRSWAQNRVLVLERKTFGFYSDTRPLESTGLYPEGNGPNGGPTESWRSDTTEKRAIGVDQPLAACWITGVRSA